MKPRLWPNARPMRCETPISNAGRNAILNNRTRGVGYFCTDLGLDFFGLVDGADAAVAKLANLLGIDPSRFELGVIRRHDQSFSLRGERLLATSLRRRRTLVCPACVWQDIKNSDMPPGASAYCRSHWLLDAIRICPEHQLELVPLQLAKNSGEYDFSTRIAPYLDAPDALPTRPLQQDHPFQAYLLNRLDKKTGHFEFLDQLEFHAAARLCELLGVTLMFGRQKFEALSNANWLAAGDLGFSYSRESGGFESALSELQNRRAWTYNDGVSAIYGRLFRWLAVGREDACFAPIRDRLRDHIVQTMPIGAGEVVLGEVVKERKIHSIRTASLEIGSEPTRLRRILRESGRLPPIYDDKIDSWSLFDAREHAGFLEGLRCAMPLATVSSYLGVGRDLAVTLFWAGYIKPFVRASTEYRIQQHLFLPQELDAFLIRLFERAVLVGNNGNVAFLDLPAAGKSAGVSTLEVLEMVLEGKLKTFRCNPGHVSFMSLLVDVREVQAAVRRNASLRDSEKLLEESGMRPALASARFGQPLYLRSDLGSGAIQPGSQLSNSAWREAQKNEVELLNEAQMARVAPLLAKAWNQPTDWHAVSGIVHVVYRGLRWLDAPPGYGPWKALYKRFVRGSRRGLFDSIFLALSDVDLKSDCIPLNLKHLQGQRTAATLLREGQFPLMAAAERQRTE